MIKERRLKALENQIRRVERALDDLERTGNRYSWARLLIFIAGFILCGLAFFLVGPWLAGIVFVPILIVFIIVLYLHGKIERCMALFRIWLDIKRAHVARARLDWDALSYSPTPLEHPLELDLDLVGEFSLLRLLDTAVSDGGSRRLRDWLSSSEPDREQSLRRQRLVMELASTPAFRDKLSLQGILAAREDRRWHSEDLLKWLEGDDQGPAIFPWLILSAVLAAVNVSLFLLDILAGAPQIWQATLLIYFSLFLIKSRELDKPFREASHLRDALEQLVAIFQQLENFTYNQAPNLKELCKAFIDPADRPSKHLSRVNRVVGATGIRGNPVFWLLLNLLVPWDFYFAYLTAKRKQEIAALLPGWMDTWFEIEALSSLANLAYLNPHYTFPKITGNSVSEDGVSEDGNSEDSVSEDSVSENSVSEDGVSEDGNSEDGNSEDSASKDGDSEIRQGLPSVVFRTESLGHPLLPDKNKINNDFSVGSLGEIDLFTGSNMSGKSTFLRTVGINLALAFSGGPVNAHLLETIPFRLFTCIRISDSVTDGISYFYAEVKCLKALLEELDRDHPLPLFYFIDEIFRGTNNRERLLGSRAFIQALVGKPGVGLVATHDLELVQLANEVPAIKNYHFTDEIVDGRMFFDYTLRPGPSPTTNALKIMQMEGLPVP